MSKKAINEGTQVYIDSAIVIEEKLFGECFENDEQINGMKNFLEKSKKKSKNLKEVPKKEESKETNVNAYIRLLNLLSSDYCLLESKLKEKDGEIFRLKNELKGK